MIGIVAFLGGELPPDDPGPLDSLGPGSVRALQRIRAANLAPPDAALLGVATSGPGLAIDRVVFLSSGEPVEYRGEAYDFVAELDPRHDR